MFDTRQRRDARRSTVDVGAWPGSWRVEIADRGRNYRSTTHAIRARDEFG